MRAQRASKPRTLLLLRHGRTSWNAERRIQGQQDPSLDETGHAQARAVAKEIAALEPAVLWSSDLARASATAGYLAEACGLDPVADRRLREYSLGERETLTHDEYAASHPGEYAAFRAGDFDVVPGGEAADEVAARMVEAVHELLAATPPGGLAVAVSHGAAIRVGLCALLGWELRVAADLAPLGNCAWAVLAGADSPTGLRLAAYNRVAAD